MVFWNLSSKYDLNHAHADGQKPRLRSLSTKKQQIVDSVESFCYIYEKYLTDTFVTNPSINIIK